MIDVNTFRELQKRTADDIRATERQLLREDISLLDLVRARIPGAEGQIDSRKLEATYRHSDALRQATGFNPDGALLALQAFQRDLTTSNSGTVAQAQNLERKLTTGLAPQSVVIGNGATIIGGIKGGALALPNVSTDVDVGGGAWIGEGSAGPQREPAFGAPRLLQPKTHVVYWDVSRRLLLQSSLDMEAELRAMVIRGWSVEFDRKAFNGNGTLEPAGLLSDTAIDVLEVGTNGGAPTWQHMVEAEHTVASRMGNMQAPAFLMSAALRKKLRTTQRGANLDYILPGSTLLDYRVADSTAVPSNLTKGTSSGVCSAMLFGDVAEIVVGFWGPVGIDFLVDPYTRGKEAMVRIVARTEVGIVARQPGALVFYKDFTTT